MLYCGKNFTKKNGLVKGVQLYKCQHCGKQFLGGNRINNKLLWEEYTVGKQTYSQLAKKYNCSIKTIQRRIDKVKISVEKPIARKVIVLMDTTYWGRNFGVTLSKMLLSKRTY
ncbi:IS1/IS1595 family N-terminal zinc-binding domain-containing protein [Capnocytophaga canimorsus]|uniref:IS1/IS1595 family N-terminal zinc-binding domain-containing protein n=1 Tax=Capnocytophaga canimorsus TaxID=28188 RepID=UPI001ACB0F3E|nr:hypothetical protein [Capnocytophaga canimorsus]GIM59644.1 hypothetical protein CAPN007_18530 [Capnocytophaga canimorsus]